MKKKSKFKQTEIGMTPEKWNLKQLGKLVNHKKGFAFKSAWFGKEGRAIIRVSDFTSDSINLAGVSYVDESLAKDFLDYEIMQDDVMVATVGSWPNNPASIVGKVIRASRDIEGKIIESNLSDTDIIFFPKIRAIEFLPSIPSDSSILQASY